MKRNVTGYFLVILLALSLSLPANLFASDHNANLPSTPKLKYKLDLDLAILAVSSTGWAIMEALKDDVAPGFCRWCSVNALDDWGHNNLKWSNTGRAHKASNVTAYALAPMAAFGLDALAAYSDDQTKNILVDSLVIAESAAVSSLVSQIVKTAVGRQRPESHYRGPAIKGPSENNVSFYSGHTSLAFSLAVASGTVASIRDYEMAPWIWGTGLAIATTTGYLRIAADKHYITDVLAGAAVGSAFGFGIPYFFHRNDKDRNQVSNTILTATPIEGGVALNLSGTM